MQSFPRCRCRTYRLLPWSLSTSACCTQSGNDVASYLFTDIMQRANKLGTFVEFGCADGVTHSNTYAFEKMGWKGLCIEPNFPLYLKAKEARTQERHLCAYHGQARQFHLRANVSVWRRSTYRSWRSARSWAR